MAETKPIEAKPREVLRTEGLTAGYDGTIVIDGISFSLEANGGLALLGRNGVGKTTLITTLMGHTQVRAGTIALAGQDITAMPIHERPPLGLGFVPQEREIFPSLTVHENMVVAVRAGAWTVERVYDLFPRLAERRRNYGNQLSGGEQQMLAIGRALVGNPKVLLLDEPFEGLAPVLVDNLMEGLRRIRAEAGMAMILVEQHAQLVLEMMPEAMILDRGQVRWRGASKELASDYAQLASLMGL
jgi:branched-chain amino acid transport system ATP-binding protein